MKEEVGVLFRLGNDLFLVEESTGSFPDIQSIKKAYVQKYS